MIEFSTTRETRRSVVEGIPKWNLGTRKKWNLGTRKRENDSVSINRRKNI